MGELAYMGWDAEFDTVIGRVGGKCLLNFVLLPSTLFFARLLERKDQECVCNAFDDLEWIFKRYRERACGQGGGVWRFFSTALTDRGSEMGDWARLERTLYPIEGTGDPVLERCRVFYCDPYSSWQKPHIEQATPSFAACCPRARPSTGSRKGRWTSSAPISTRIRGRTWEGRRPSTSPPQASPTGSLAPSDWRGSMPTRCA